jgi:hypothetical protein
MRIDPEIEQPTRTMLRHAIQGELQELATMIDAAGDGAYRESIALCLATAGYVAVDASGRWPTSADKWEIARDAAHAAGRYKLGDSDVYNYLSRAALGAEPLDDVFGSVAAAGTMPVLITARLLVSFRPQGMDWSEYLDTIEAALEAAGHIDLTVLPALTLRAHQNSAVRQ